jgi:uncharacterized protein YfaT (DUF1175 family)
MWGIAVLLLVGCASQRPHELDPNGPALDPAELRSEIVMTALAQLGTPYRYGGTHPQRGFDCSGLVYFAHQSVGLQVPRAATAQRASARSVAQSELRPGDLVFFRIQRGYHVGIVLDDERFIHAPSAGKRVEIARFDSSYWSRRYLGAGTFLAPGPSPARAKSFVRSPDSPRTPGPRPNPGSA